MFTFVNAQIFWMQGDLSFYLVVDELFLIALAALREKNGQSNSQLAIIMPEPAIEYPMDSEAWETRTPAPPGGLSCAFCCYEP